jgi:hypothetical protein
MQAEFQLAQAGTPGTRRAGSQLPPAHLG